MAELTSGTSTVVMAEGRKVLRLSRELSSKQFGILLNDLQCVLRETLEKHGGSGMEVAGDTVSAAFASPRSAVAAAVAAQQAVMSHVWLEGRNMAVSIGLDSGGAAAGCCALICDIAEGGQIFLSAATAALLEDADLGELSLRDLGELPARRTGERAHVFELVRGGG